MIDNNISKLNENGAEKETTFVSINPRDDSTLLFNERVISMSENKNLPLFERAGFVKIAVNNLIEYISTRFSRLSVKKQGYARTKINELFERCSNVSTQLICIMKSKNIQLMDTFIKVTPKNLMMPDKGLWNIIPSHYYAFMIRIDDPAVCYLVDIGTSFADLTSSKLFYHCIIKFIPELNFPFISNELNSNTMEEYKAVNLLKTQGKIKHAVAWFGSDEKLNNIIKAELENRKLILFYLSTDALMCYKDMSKTKQLYPEYCFPKLESRYTDIDFYKELSSSKKSYLFRTPYDSFHHVEKFIDDMCINPNVESVYITLYRIANNSNIVKSLIKAAETGKFVCVFMEANARGDEDSNLAAIQLLNLYADRYNINVICNYVGKKVHSKIFIARTKNALYTHCGTGNYNENTANQYIDLHYITNDPIVGQLAMDVFEMITAQKRTEINNKYVAATIEKEILKEIDKGEEGMIRIKCNHLSDPRTVELLNIAGKNGVKVNLIIRTTIGIPSVGNVKVKSIVGRYLEHERFYIFGKDKDARAYMGSSDLLYRNLYRRMESLVPINTKSIVSDLCKLFNTEFEI